MATENNLHFLSIDIGGSNIKSTVLNANGEMQIDYQKIATPHQATPEATIEAIKKLISSFPAFDKVSVGFPGFVKAGVVYTAPNLHNVAWQNYPFAQALSNELKKPVRLVNDADLQGLALISRQGLEMVMTLGTGFGTALFMDGKLLPHLELSHLPVAPGIDYDDYIGEKAFQSDGQEKWNTKMKGVLSTFKTVINYDKLYLSGGNAKKINFQLDDNVKVVSNRDGIKGGAFLWAIEDDYCVKTVSPQ